jgi:carboxyl-terminal processing protease
MKVYRYLVIGIVALVLLAGTFSGGVIVGWALPGRNVNAAALPISQPPQGTPVAGQPTPTDTDTLFAPFWETWTIVHDQYVDQPVDDEALMRGAISGMLQALGDPHTSYMTPKEYLDANNELSGQEYEGIGAWVDITGEFLTVISPMSGSPAEKAGLKPGDVVIKVDQEDMTGIDGELVLKRILGEAGTDVTLTIMRQSEPETFDVTITRAKIIVPSVEGKMLDNNIAYVHVYTFGDKTTNELQTVLKDLMKQKPVGLILDLRYNGGGYLDTAIQVVSEFLPGDKIAMYEEFGDSNRREFTTQRGGLATDIPLVVLVNEGTASASEITAGAIQDYLRGKLVGVTTYGKGSVQNWIPLTNEQGAVRVTIARWLTPKERQINEVGLEPDYKVEITDADVEAGKDPQLEKAIQLLTPGG